MKRRLLFGAEAALRDEPQVGAGFAVTARVQGPLELDPLHHALARLQARHPALSARVVVEDGEPYLTDEGAPPIPVRIVEREHDDAWAREVEAEIQRPTSYHTGRLCRLVWVRGGEISDLILICDHSAGDGRSGVVALRDLLALVANPDLRLAPLKAPPLTALIPPALVDYIASLPQPSDAPGGNPWGWEAPSPSPLRVMPLALSAEETSALLARCREERVTVQAALCAAFLTPFAEREPEADAQRVETPVDLRGRLTEPPHDAFGNYISSTVVAVRCAPGRDRWEVAREAREALSAALSDERLFSLPLFVYLVTGRPPAGPMFPRDYDLSISNLGRVDIPSAYGPLRLESIYAPTLHVERAGHRILGATTYGGRLRCTFTSRDPDTPALAARGLAVLHAMIGR